MKNLEAAEEDSYNKNVWVSGAHMRIAEMYMAAGDRADNIKLVGEHIRHAEEIISGDDRLVLRKEQLDKLKSKYADR